MKMMIYRELFYIFTILFLMIVDYFRIKTIKNNCNKKLAFIKKYYKDSIFVKRDPLITDKDYYNFQIWINIETRDIFILADKNTVKWEKLSTKY